MNTCRIADIDAGTNIVTDDYNFSQNNASSIRWWRQFDQLACCLTKDCYRVASCQLLPADHIPNYFSTTNHRAICRFSGRSSRTFSGRSGYPERMRSSRNGDRDHAVTLGTPNIGGSSRDELCSQRGQAGNCCGAVYTKNQFACFLRPPLTHSPLQRAKLIVRKRAGVLDLQTAEKSQCGFFRSFLEPSHYRGPGIFERIFAGAPVMWCPLAGTISRPNFARVPSGGQAHQEAV